MGIGGEGRGAHAARSLVFERVRDRLRVVAMKEKSCMKKMQPESKVGKKKGKETARVRGCGDRKRRAGRSSLSSYFLVEQKNPTISLGLKECKSMSSGVCVRVLITSGSTLEVARYRRRNQLLKTVDASSEWKRRRLNDGSGRIRIKYGHQRCQGMFTYTM
ncbi:hypothetical protein C8R42DRAFT_181558 [Lentinula raphanica]|nr:hypothetical protein C8R42DRAFT_181558 [Lentinula raphanica]